MGEEIHETVEVVFLDKCKKKFLVPEAKVNKFIEDLQEQGVSFTDIYDGRKFTRTYPAHMVGRISVEEPD